MDVTTKPGSELVQLPPITAAQRQTLIAVLHAEHARRSNGSILAERANEITALAHALDLHLDAVRAVCSPAGEAAGNAAPDLDTCDRCGKAEERIHVGHYARLGYDGLCSACYLTTPALGEAAPDPEPTVLQCFDCGKRTDEYAGLSCRASHLHKVSQ